jgi:hypothetical protein
VNENERLDDDIDAPPLGWCGDKQDHDWHVVVDKDGSYECLGHTILATGLCANKEDHVPHLVTKGTLAPFMCTADQTPREPNRSELRRNSDHRNKA